MASRVLVVGTTGGDHHDVPVGERHRLQEPEREHGQRDQRERHIAFIVGAPRCGTTTLASFLQQHPDVCFSAVKEPHFFSRDEVAALPEDKLERAIEEEYWQRFFGHCDDDAQLYAEGSVTYLYVPERMAPILKRWPDAKFVIALRDPLSMLPSLHARLLVTGDETIRDFRKAWAKIGERAQGKSLPKRAMTASLPSASASATDKVLSSRSPVS